jgi:hypothetical protein
MVKRQKKVQIRGLAAYLYAERDGYQTHTYKRKLVSPEWINLWYLISAGEFDQSLYISLNQIDKDFLAYCVHQTGIHNSDFEIALARDYRNTLERMRVLEGSIKAGNVNPEIAKEFNEIIDRLVSSWQISSKMGTSLKSSMNRTLKAALEAKS